MRALLLAALLLSTQANAADLIIARAAEHSSTDPHFAGTSPNGVPNASANSGSATMARVSARRTFFATPITKKLMPSGRIRCHGRHSAPPNPDNAPPRKSAYLNRPRLARFSTTPRSG